MNIIKSSTSKPYNAVEISIKDIETIQLCANYSY